MTATTYTLFNSYRKTTTTTFTHAYSTSGNKEQITASSSNMCFARRSLRNPFNQTKGIKESFIRVMEYSPSWSFGIMPTTTAKVRKCIFMTPSGAP